MQERFYHQLYTAILNEATERTRATPSRHRERI